jgi:mannose-6-phosphate isomerase-like protein (cupin superfamily)
MEVIKGAGVFTRPAAGPNHWVEHLAVQDLSVGTYSIPAGGVDDQQPHDEDEIYIVRGGLATVAAGSGSAQVGPGSMIYIPAGEAHQFTDIREDLSLIVVFAPAYGSRGRALRSAGPA